MQSGFAGIKFAAAASLLFGLTVITGQVRADGLSLTVTGNLLGAVTDGAGIPQMGATVQLLNRYEKVLQKAITSANGHFEFAGLPYDVYSVRVSQPSFLPAFQDRITVKPGQDSYLQIHLATLFSRIQVSYKVPAGTMTSDWKWALRTSSATRPVTRYLPELKQKQPKESAESRGPIFSGTHAMVRLNGGDSGLFSEGLSGADLGPVFAVSTNVFGKNQVQLAGALGQNPADSAIPFMPRSLAMVYRRNSDNPFMNTPEVTLAMTQFNHLGLPFSGPGQAQELRVLSLNLYQATDPLDNLHMEYGLSGQSVNYLQDRTRATAYGRATLSLGPETQFIAAYSNGGRPDGLLAHSANQVADQAVSPAGDAAAAVDALGRLPLMTSRNNRLALQRTENYEVGVSRKVGGRTYALSGFREQVWNGQLLLGGNMQSIDPSDLLFDGLSKTSTYDIGAYHRTGFAAAITQKVTEYVDFGLAYGRMGGFSTVDPSHMFDTGRSNLHTGLYDVAGAKVRASIPVSGTRLTAGYGWMQTGAFIPVHMFVTQNNIVTPGLNIRLQQPLPSLFGMPGHLELTADLRNLLAQGYIPVGSGGASQMLILQSPRAIRGGLNITF